MTEIERLEAELRAAQDAIDAAYWRFTRTTSPNVPPPAHELYVRRNAIRTKLMDLKRLSAPKRGLRFIHSKWLNADYQPATYEVTRVARGVVYYRPVDGGHSHYCPADDFPSMVREVVS